MTGAGPLRGCCNEIWIRARRNVSFQSFQSRTHVTEANKVDQIITLIAQCNVKLMSPKRNLKTIHDICLYQGLKTVSPDNSNPSDLLVVCRNTVYFGVAAQRATAVGGRGVAYLCLLQELRPSLTPRADTFGNINNSWKPGYSPFFSDQEREAGDYGEDFTSECCMPNLFQCNSQS